MNRDNILIFVAGVVVGGAAGYFYGKSKERSAAEKDIQEAKEGKAIKSSSNNRDFTTNNGMITRYKE